MPTPPSAGPSKSGKTACATYLAGLSDSIVPAAAPAPTIGVRVLELERQGIAVELWDVSGDQAFETTWPAVQQGADGVVLVYAPEVPGQAVRGGGCLRGGGVGGRRAPPVLRDAGIALTHALCTIVRAEGD